MTTKLKEVIHLYLGCEVMINDARLENRIDTLDYLNSGGDCGGHEQEWEVKNCQLILRPLSDMTEAEKLQLAAFERLWSHENILPTIKVGHLVQLHYSEKGAQITRWLLERQFDLFGLIPSGEAINKSTLQ